MEARLDLGPGLTGGLLAEAGRLLGSSLELEDTLRTVAALAIPEFADWTVVDVLVPGGPVRSLTSGHADPRIDALILELRRRHRGAPQEDLPQGGLLVQRDGEPRLYRATEPEDLPLASEEERELWRTLGAVSWLIAPLRHGGRVLGTLSFLSTDPDRVYGEQDLPVGLELADRCAQALHNAQLYEAAESSRVLLDTVFETAPIGLALVDVERRFVLVNDRMAELNRLPVADHVGRSIIDALGPTAAGIDELVRGILESGEGVADLEVVADERAFLVSYSPVAIDGRTLGVIAAVVETSGRRAAEAERERLLARTTRLQQVTEHLSAALTEAQVARVILEEAMAASGASCGVLGVVDAARGALVLGHRIGMAGDAPVHVPLEAEAPMPRAALDLAPVLLPSRDAWLERFPALPPRGDFEAFAAVPLLFEGAVQAVMGLGYPVRRTFEAPDVDLLVAIARQGAQALERARLYEERDAIARTLQAGLLPGALPAIDGLQLGVRYRPIGDGAEVGGDFYDVVPLGGEEWLAVVGDICGKGIGAAVLTGVMRSTIRALAHRAERPGELLRGVNAALMRERSSQALATVACATVRRDGDGFLVHLAAGGHPPALVLRAGGAVEAVAASGPLLGMREDIDLVEVDVRLAAGDLLLLYTDGVIDARRNGGMPFGEERLQHALAAGAGEDLEAVLDGIDAAVRAYAPGPARDDKALLALRPAVG